MPVVTATICDASGTPMPSTHEVLAIDVEREVGRVPRCALKLLDGDLTKATFPLSDTPIFEPGAQVTVKLRYEKKGAVDVVVFKGLVVRHGLELSRRGSILNVELKDPAVALTQPRRSAVHVDATDAATISKLARAAGLVPGAVAETATKHPQLVQYHASDWDFILARAEALGLVFAVTDGTFTLAAPVPTDAAKLRLELGKDELFGLELEADGHHQLAAVESVAWDPAARAATEPAAAAAVKTSFGNLDGAAIAGKLGFPAATLSHGAALDLEELKAWANGRMARSRMAMVRGRVATRGRADVALLDVVELVGVGARFTGTSVVTGVRHRVTTNGWQTDLQLGFSPELYAAQPRVHETPATGLLPAVSGLQVGVVAPFVADDLKLGRIKVLLPGLGGTEAVWARMAAPDAGAGRGYVFRPEKGDEVVVGFFASDPRQPVILGAMFGKQNAAPKDFGEPDADNLLRGIVSKKGVTIGIIDDEKPSVFIETPAKNKVLFDDSGELVHVSDQHGNAITLDKNGITITSAKDLTLEASGEVVIKGSKVDVQ